MENLIGKVALITGGTKGIGYGIAVAFLNQGIHVAITGRNGTTIRETLNELNNHGTGGSYAIGIEADVRDYEGMQNVVDQIVEEFGKLDVDLLKMHPRTLPSKIEVRPSIPPG
jgi:3-oxoacyl-[acyl-carrier protein] reductase